MSDETETVRHFSHAELKDFIARALKAVGMNDENATIVSGLMAGMDLHGLDGHGLFRLPQYIRRIQKGGMEVNPDIRAVNETPAMAVLDGGNGMGHLIMHRAAHMAMDKAEECGIGWVGARMSNHAGSAGAYASIALERDMIGIYMAVGSANHLPPWGGIDMLLSTNPIAAAIPGGDELPIIMDMATTVAAYGKVKMAAQRGEMMPEGWMIDRQGKPLTDPNRASEGFLLPIGGYKGFGLALLFGILAGTLNGAALGKDVVDFNADEETLTNTGHCILAISPKVFGDLDTFKAGIDRIIGEMKASDTLPGVEKVRMPGEGSQAKAQERARDGIPVHTALLDVLAVTASDLGIERLDT